MFSIDPALFNYVGLFLSDICMDDTKTWGLVRLPYQTSTCIWQAM